MIRLDQHGDLVIGGLTGRIRTSTNQTPISMEYPANHLSDLIESDFHCELPFAWLDDTSDFPNVSIPSYIRVDR